jgi:hypothetical protein
MRIALVLLLAGCASTTGVVPLGGGSYSVSHKGATAGSSVSDLRNQALRDAGVTCPKGFDVIAQKDSEPPYMFGRYPTSEITFRCKA